MNLDDLSMFDRQTRNEIKRDVQRDFWQGIAQRRSALTDQAWEITAQAVEVEGRGMNANEQAKVSALMEQGAALGRIVDAMLAERTRAAEAARPAA